MVCQVQIFFALLSKIILDHPGVTEAQTNTMGGILIAMCAIPPLLGFVQEVYDDLPVPSCFAPESAPGMEDKTYPAITHDDRDRLRSSVAAGTVPKKLLNMIRTGRPRNEQILKLREADSKGQQPLAAAQI